MVIKTDNYFAKEVHIRGNGLEERVEKYLLSMYIPFQRNKNNGIDFIINGYIYLDCVAQGQSGSIGDKLPHKAFKYIQKYGLKDIYILHPYSPITKSVGEHLIFLEEQFNTKIHILDWADFTYLMNGGIFDSRKPYNYVTNSAKIKNTPANNITLHKFFEFNK
jgi:hypothetical protein